MKKKLRVAAIVMALVCVMGVLTACGGVKRADLQAEINGVEIPATYTKYIKFTGTYGFGDADVYYMQNKDGSEFMMYFYSFDEDQVVQGTVAGGVVTVTYDLTGFMTGDAQTIYEDAMAQIDGGAKWTSIAKK